ncbi:hypothetical protein CEE36_05780 [candidate division TA06 bacterium B3_TA06]|uniref:FlgD/Vpr Ig-like domain-containing protein n=1 Tax=candidate division TA06 bacterium B3_TA06 TaxID=2012487 RepID=A0A532V721_UNCT6|nr:MAG: hypothetical protein CEE36_05780 [candidate division TA06 bacterium B3_TA06]
MKKEDKMKRYTSLIAVALVLILSTGLTAQVTEEWVVRYSTPGGDGADDVAVDGSGNVYITGYRDYGDFLTIKYNSAGVQQWVAIYDGPAHNEDQAIAIAVDDSRNVYVTGRSRSLGTGGTGRDYATIKYNISGVQQWVVRYDGGGDDWPRSIAVDASGNVYVTGYSAGTMDDYATVKYNSAGVQQWVRRYNGPGNDNDRAGDIAVDGAGNVYVTGYSKGSGTGYDHATIKYNSAGVQQWVARYNGPGNSDDFTRSLALDVSGNVYVTGTSAGLGTGNDYATIKYNSSGQQQWVTRYNSPGNGHDRSYDIVVDGAGNVYVTGYSPGTMDDYATVKYNSSGQQQWVAYYNGTGNEHDRPNSLAVDASGNVYVTGYSEGFGTSDDYATVKYNSAGVQQWVMRYNGPGNKHDFPGGIEVDGVGNVYVTGHSYGSGTYDCATIKYSQPVTNDVAPVSIDAPEDTVWSEYTYTPKATVANFSEDTSFTFDVVCEFDSAGAVVYSDTATVIDLAAGDSIQVSFADWTAGEADGLSYTMTVTTLLEEDTRPGNDMLSKTVTAIWPPRDVAPVAILTPPDRVWAGCLHTPRAIVANFWESTESFDVLCEFDSAGTTIYSETATVSDLAGGDSVLVEFPSWSAGAVDEFTYTMTVTTLLAKDLTPENDTISKQVAALRAVPDLDIQDYAGNLSANTMELTGVANSIVVGAYVMSNPDNWEKNVDLFDGPANIDLDLAYSCTDLSTYGGGWMIPAANIDPDLNEVSSLGLGKAEQNIVQVYIPSKAHFETHVGKVVAVGTAEDGSTDADEFTLKVNVVADKGGGKPTSFGGEPLAQGNHLYWTNFGFGEQGFNLYRSEPESKEFGRLNEELMDFTEYTDYDVEAEADYLYKLGLDMGDGSEVLIGPLTLTSSEEIGSIVLEQNWPNPWTDATEICYFLPKGADQASLKVYDISGKLVRTLAQGRHEAGSHTAIWDGTDAKGLSVSSGVYFYRLSADDQTKTGKMVLLR